ncbi:MAG TPA: radical SAM protein [Spirochaetota bacterium]|nr:radical SAM protein [Spirochaetota bacterium]HPV41132.1 radical SAM protein [Spirochaetota bacterium]
MSNVFGPVPSRRLGRSLGIDLVPFKTCTYDCLYCQLGRTTHRTMERKEWFPLGDILSEVKERMSSKPDYITLSGSGEPTLYSRLGDLIEGIRAMTDIPVAVLTNGSLLWDRDIRLELAGAHLVVPSLDAGDDVIFQKVNRPYPDISFVRMVQGHVDFRKEYHGNLWLEVFILDGITSTREEVLKIAALAKKIAPDRVQLNTVTRPPAEDTAVKVKETALPDIARLFDPPAEIIADFRKDTAGEDFTTTRESVLDTIRRRPCSVEDIAGGLGIHRHEALKHIEELLARGQIEKTSSGGTVYYRRTGKNNVEE